jgi:hypothetical protein
MERKPAHGLYHEFKYRYLYSRQISRSGRLKAFLEAIRTILWW